MRTINTLLTIVLAGLLTGCGRKIYLTTTERTYHTDTIVRYEKHLERDTLRKLQYEREYRKDSVAPVFDSVGRHIGYDRWHIVERTKDADTRAMAERIVRDSVGSKHTDIRQTSDAVTSSTGRQRRWIYLILTFAGGLIAGICIGCRKR